MSCNGGDDFPSLASLVNPTFYRIPFSELAFHSPDEDHERLTPLSSLINVEHIRGIIVKSPVFPVKKIASSSVSLYYTSSDLNSLKSEYVTARDVKRWRQSPCTICTV